MADKKYKLDLDPGKVVYVSIRRYSDGYSFANMALKMGEEEYLVVNYEWRGNDIPEFAMDVMDIMQKFNKKETSSIDSETLERASKVLAENAEELKNQ